MANNSWVSLLRQWYKMLVTCCKALSHYNLICCHMLAQKGCNSIIHWCIGHVGSRNVGLVSSRAAQICVGLWFLRFLGTLVQLSAGSFWEGGAGKEVVTWIIFLIAFSPVVASAQPRRPQTIDWEPKWILKAGKGRNQTSFATKGEKKKSVIMPKVINGQLYLDWLRQAGYCLLLQVT